MKTMKAIVWTKTGPAKDALTLHTDWPVPKRKDNQLLVEVAATSVNAGEWKLRSGFVDLPVSRPKILGEDMAGIVREAPPTSQFKPGDKVFACTGQAMKRGDRGGTYSEFVAVEESCLAHMPAGVSFLDAAAVPIAGLTAWQALEQVMPLAGKRILVHAGAGGVGGSAIQIAKAQGAHVTTTCSTRNVAYVTKELGADVAIDYTKVRLVQNPTPYTLKTNTKGRWEKQAEGPYDLVIDAVGGSYETASMKLLGPNGLIVTLGATGPNVKHVSLWGLLALLWNAWWRTLLGKLRLAPRYMMLMQEPKASRGLQQIGELMEQGKFKVFFDKVFTLEEMVAAHELAESGHVRGRIGVWNKKELQ